MSKIESRDFWVSGSVFKILSSGIGVISASLSPVSHGNSIEKITVSWEAPEKVVTISESEFEDAAGYFRTHLNEQEYLKLKAEIFKDKV